MTIHAVEEHEGYPILVMEYIRGRSLRQRIHENAPLALVDLLRISAQIAAGLAAAHAQGVIHRDIKPANIMLEDGIERVKIADFGLARVAIDNAELTSQGHAVGTPAYMSPEQVLGRPIDARSDLFSLGCVMYAMVARHSPFRGTHPTEIARKITDLHPPLLHEVDPRAPEFLSQIVDRLLAKLPQDRFQTADEVARLLMDHLASINQLHSDELRATLLRPPQRRQPPRKRRRAAWSWAIGAAVLVGAAIGGWQWWKSGLPKDVVATAGLESNQAGVGLHESGRELPRPARTLTVAKEASALYQTISAALSDAQPTDSIEVLDDAVYEEALALNNPQRHRGLRLISQRGATLRAPGKYAVVAISRAPEVSISGFRIESNGNQHAMTITGPCVGLSIRDVAIRAASAGNWALVHITQQASGSIEQPILLENLRLETATLGIVIHGDSRGSVSHLRIRNNRFQGEGKHIQLNRSLEDVQVTANLFVSGTGVVGNFPAADQARDVLVANNTFHACSPWLDRGDSVTAQQGITFCNNLILGPGQLAASARLAELAGSWSFRHNIWEAGSPEDESVISSIAQPAAKVGLLSRDPAHPDFLRPSADSPLGDAGLGEPLPAYVGALPPRKQQP
jgi:hypothetical protein